MSKIQYDPATQADWQMVDTGYGDVTEQDEWCEEHNAVFSKWHNGGKFERPWEYRFESPQIAVHFKLRWR